MTIYMTFPNSESSKDKEFNGIIEWSGKNNIILSDPKTGKWHLLPLANINFITFDEIINLGKNF